MTVLLITMAFAFTGLVGNVSGESSEEKVLVIAMSTDVQAMDPAKTSAMYGPPGLIYETLITRDLNGDYADGLAEWWNMNRTDPNHPTFMIKLREGVKFHDGLPFNTDAVKRVINYYAQDDSWVQYEFWAIYGCQNKTGWPDAGIWCKDDYNMVLNLTWADVALEFNLSHLYGSMMGPDALEEDGLGLYGTANGQVVGTGPYMLDEWVPGDHITLVKNPDYDWGFSWYENKGPANIDTIIYRIIADESTRLAGFDAGSIDVLQQVPPSAVSDYLSDSDITVITGPGQGTYHVEFNCQKDPWSNPTLRKAFCYAVNRAQILDVVWHGIGEEGVNLLSPIEPESRNVPAEYNYTYDLDMAMELFEAAGFTDTDDDGWLENASDELYLDLWTTNKGEDIQMGEIVQTQFEDVGVHVTLTPYAETQLRDMASEGSQEAIIFWYSWPRAEILDWHFGTWAVGGSNTGWYMDDVFDDYVTNWTYAETEQEFSDNATAAHIRLLEQAAWTPLIFWHQIFAVHNYVTFKGDPGWAVNPFGLEQVINIVDVDMLVSEITGPTLSITTPVADAVLSEPTAVVTGTTDPDVTLIVNGLLVAVEANGAFELTIALVDGTNEIRATATDDDGTSTVSINVTYVNPVPHLMEQISSLENETSQLLDELENARDSLDASESQLEASNETIDSLKSTQILLLVVVALIAIVLAVMGIAVLRMRKIGEPPSA